MESNTFFGYVSDGLTTLLNFVGYHLGDIGEMASSATTLADRHSAMRRETVGK